MPDLFVIEAPGKAKLLEGILRELRIDAKVQATRGHFMSMPGKLRPLGIDRRMREFMRVPSNPEVFMRLRDMAREADNLLIATDADQEGDVIAWDVHEATRDIHPLPRRVKLKGMDHASIREAIAAAGPVEKAAAVPGRARGILDRMIGGVFGSPQVPAGRVSTAILGLVASGQPSVLKIRLAAPAKDRRRPWIAEFDLAAPLDAKTAERLVALDLPPSDPPAIRSRTRRPPDTPATSWSAPATASTCPRPRHRRACNVCTRRDACRTRAPDPEA